MTTALPDKNTQRRYLRAWSLKQSEQRSKNAKPSGGLILHRDNCFQYTSQEYYNVTKANNMKPSMSSVGCPYDNTCAEIFFSILKTKCIYLAKPQTFDEAKELVDAYIVFYKKERIQFKTKQTPMEVRSAYAA